jgi:hypothetical protein
MKPWLQDYAPPMSRIICNSETPSTIAHYHCWRCTVDFGSENFLPDGVSKVPCRKSNLGSGVRWPRGVRLRSAAPGAAQLAGAIERPRGSARPHATVHRLRQRHRQTAAKLPPQTNKAANRAALSLNAGRTSGPRQRFRPDHRPPRRYWPRCAPAE